MYPVHDMINNLGILCIRERMFVLTMADGKVLYENGEYMTIDIERRLSSRSRNAYTRRYWHLFKKTKGD